MCLEQFLNWFSQNLHWIIPLIVTLIVIYIGAWYGVGHSLPKFKLKLIVSRYRGLPKVHCILCQKINDAEHPVDYQLYYATPTTNGWKKLTMEGRQDALPKNKGEWGGSWIPFVLSEDMNEKKRFWFGSPESSIIWRLDYYTTHFTHSSYDMFSWDGEEWKPHRWYGNYTHGIIAYFLNLGSYVFNKARKQIKEWKKINKKHLQKSS